MLITPISIFPRRRGKKFKTRAGAGNRKQEQFNRKELIELKIFFATLALLYLKAKLGDQPVAPTPFLCLCVLCG